MTRKDFSARAPSEGKVISVRLQEGDLRLLDGLCELLGMNRSEVVRNAIQAYVGQVATVLRTR